MFAGLKKTLWDIAKIAAEAVAARALKFLKGIGATEIGTVAAGVFALRESTHNAEHIRDFRYDENVKKYGKNKADQIRSASDERKTDPMYWLRKLNPFARSEIDAKDISVGKPLGHEYKELKYTFSKDIKFKAGKITFKNSHGKSGEDEKPKPNTSLSTSGTTAATRYNDNVAKYGKEKADALKAVEDRPTSLGSVFSSLSPSNWGHKGDDTQPQPQQSGSNQGQANGKDSAIPSSGTDVSKLPIPQNTNGSGKYNLYSSQGIDPRGNWAKENIVPVETPYGKINVNKNSAAAFKGYFDDMKTAGAPLKTLGSYNLREKRSAGAGHNPGSGWSEHSFGNALDMDNTTSLSPAMQKWIAEDPSRFEKIKQKWGMKQGIKGDLPHTEFGGVLSPEAKDQLEKQAKKDADTPNPIEKSDAGNDAQKAAGITKGDSVPVKPDIPTPTKTSAIEPIDRSGGGNALLAEHKPHSPLSELGKTKSEVFTYGSERAKDFPGRFNNPYDYGVTSWADKHPIIAINKDIKNADKEMDTTMDHELRHAGRKMLIGDPDAKHASDLDKKWHDYDFEEYRNRLQDKDDPEADTFKYALMKENAQKNPDKWKSMGDHFRPPGARMVHDAKSATRELENVSTDRLSGIQAVPAWAKITKPDGLGSRYDKLTGEPLNNLTSEDLSGPTARQSQQNIDALSPPNITPSVDVPSKDFRKYENNNSDPDKGRRNQNDESDDKSTGRRSFSEYTNNSYDEAG
jgi:hypothetical protein